MSQSSHYYGFLAMSPNPLTPTIPPSSPQQDSPNSTQCMALILGICLHHSLDEVSPTSTWVVTNPSTRDVQFRLCINCCQESKVGPSLQTHGSFPCIRILPHSVKPTSPVISLSTFPLHPSHNPTPQLLMPTHPQSNQKISFIPSSQRGNC